MEAKKRKLSEASPHLECCVCGESGSQGFANIYNISLREKDDFLISFVEVVSFVLGIEVIQESSDICISCKPKIIEYYHFKKRSQSIQKKLSPLIQEIMKIVNNYITKNDIKAITIEESREKLVLMEKIHPQQPVTQELNEIVEIKREHGEEVSHGDLMNDTLMEPDIIIKEEIVDEFAIKQEPLDVDESLNTHEISLSNDEQPIPNVISDNSDLTKLDQILNLNKEIFNVISSLDYKINEMRGGAPSTSKAKNNIVPYKLTNAIRPQRE